MRKKVKFGSLSDGSIFWFRGDQFRKVDESFGVLVGTNKRIEFGWNLSVEIDDVYERRW